MPVFVLCATVLHVLTDPRENQVRNPQVVLVLHQHVAVAEDPGVGQVEHRRIATRIIDLLDEMLATGKRRLPQSTERRHVGEMVAILDRVRHTRTLTAEGQNVVEPEGSLSKAGR